MKRKEETWIFYNLKVGRDRERVEMELDALEAEFRPKGIVGCEANGYALWRLPRLGRPVRSLATGGRANLYAYGDYRKPKWIDHKRTWKRVKYAGTHPARATLVLRPRRSLVGRVIVGHAPQVAKETTTARVEWLGIMERLFGKNPFRRTLALLDANALGKNLAQIVGGVHDGNLTDCAVARGLSIQVRMAHVADGVAMLSDHPAVVVTVSRRRWLR